MDEVEREGGPDQPVREQDEPQPAEAAGAEPAPTLLQELATLGPTEDVGPDVAEPPVDEDDDLPARPRVRTSTKVVVVAAAWLLLTLVLVSRFSSDGPQANSSTRLDQAAAGDEEAAGDEGEASGDAEPGDASAGEAGDGEYSDGVAVYGDDPSAGAVSGGAGGGGVYAGVPHGDSGGVGGGAAVPGAAPGESATATSTAPAAGPGGGSATTVAPAGGGTTDTTAPSAGAGGGSTSTTAAPSPAAPGPAATVHISWNGNKFVYDNPNFSVPSGSVVRMINDTDDPHTWKMGKSNLAIPPRGFVDRTITASSQFGCDTHRYMTGRITVT